MTSQAMTRRAALGAIASVPAIAGATALPVALAAAETVTPHERFQAALAELKAAAEALDPRIYDWTIKSNGNLNCGILITAWRTTTEYEGDGWYASHYGDSDNKKVFVERAPEHDRNGERWFRITSYYRGKKAWAFTPERDFKTNYGRKLGEQLS
ncbi:hypothetical protein EN873_24985 [bacterium M00.F.Ca.ET.230.01.1.1]|nr:hypothetical protein EN873_24985 [bacterium M00.F.Ca.ET.230.01.1.1]